MAAPTAPIMGFNGKAFYNSGTYGSPTWVALNNVGSIKVTDEMNESQLQLRSQGGFEVTVPGLRKVGFEFDSVYDPADTAQSALRTKYTGRTKTDFLFLDGDSETTGSFGTRVLAIITKFPRQEEINDAMMVNVAIKPTYDNTNVPVSAFTAS